MAPQICDAKKTAIIDNELLLPAFSSFHCYQIVTLSDHPLNLVLWHRTIQNNRVPMLFILMIPRNHGRICIWKCQTILQYFFSCFHCIILLQNLISYIFRHAGKVPISPLLYLSTKKQIRLPNPEYHYC